MNIITIVMAFLTALDSDNSRLYWYVPISKKSLPYSGIRVELFPFALLKLIDTPVIPVIFKHYSKGARFASVTGDRLVSKLINAGCTVDTIRCIYYDGQMIGQYNYYTDIISDWRGAELAEIALHKKLFGADSAIDISTLSIAEQAIFSGIRQVRKYDIFTTAQFKELIEVKFGQAYIEDYTT